VFSLLLSAYRVKLVITESGNVGTRIGYAEMQICLFKSSSVTLSECIDSTAKLCNQFILSPSRLLLSSNEFCRQVLNSWKIFQIPQM